MTPEEKKQIIQAIKERWIEDYGGLQESREWMDAYFVAGFVEIVLNDFIQQPWL